MTLTITLSLGPGSTYSDLHHALSHAAELFPDHDSKPEGPEDINFHHESTGLDGNWRIER